MRSYLTICATLFLACGGGDDSAKAQLAGDLVSCKNDVSSLKEQLADAKAALAKAQEAAGMMVKLSPVDIKTAAQAQVVHKGVEGNVSPEAVVKVVQQNAAGLKSCYERALKRKPELQYVSSLTARFQVRSSGNAFDVFFSPRTDGEMEKCMAQAMGKWKFPTFEGDPVHFEAPVNLVAK